MERKNMEQPGYGTYRIWNLEYMKHTTYGTYRMWSIPDINI
jgi:hypothetical protein